MIALPFDRRPALVGVVHLGALPGAPAFAGDLPALLGVAAEEARVLAQGGCDGVIVENFGDVPFHPGAAPPETIAAMALAVEAVRGAVDVPVGVNVLRNDARGALGLCAATGAAFLRVNVHAGAAVTDQGVIEGRAAETLRERTRLGLEVPLLADVFVKHATPLGDTPLEEAARELVGRALADGVLVTGAATGSAPDAAVVAAVRGAVGDAPVLVASGVTFENAATLCEHADGAIVGTALKQGGRVDAPVDLERVRAMRTALG